VIDRFHNNANYNKLTNALWVRPPSCKRQAMILFQVRNLYPTPGLLREDRGDVQTVKASLSGGLIKPDEDLFIDKDYRPLGLA
jgi:hypothetical protein